MISFRSYFNSRKLKQSDMILKLPNSPKLAYFTSQIVLKVLASSDKCQYTLTFLPFLFTFRKLYLSAKGLKPS